MAHYVAYDAGKREFLYHRRTKGQRMYEARAVWGGRLEEARVFTTKSSAANSATSAGRSPAKGFVHVLEVKLDLLETENGRRKMTEFDEACELKTEEAGC